MSADPDDITRRIEWLEALVDNPAELVRLDAQTRRRLLEAAGKLSRPSAGDKRKRARAFRKQDTERVRSHDEGVLSRSALRKQKSLSSFLPESLHALLDVPPASPEAPEEAEQLVEPRACYVCKADYDRVHAFYHSMCPPCAALNFAKRNQSADLRGKVALVTGARIKIGYWTALKLLRAGARVLVTTRFPVDAAKRFAAEPDAAEICERLTIHGLDLRHTPTVERFASSLASSLDRLDVIVHNAAQTVRRPPAFYEHLLAGERAPLNELPSRVVPLLAPTADADDALAKFTGVDVSSLAWKGEEASDPALFPPDHYDGDDQQIDLRQVNSWRLPLEEVPTPELLEVHLVNAVAPFVLTSRLRALMNKDRTDDKHVIVVSAMEASFSRKKKTHRHPHTNMAKAALNMMTRTCAADFAKDGIFMNSVDTGWVTDEDPLHHASRKQRVHDFHAPLDSVDGAARVLDPLFAGLAAGEHPWGIFFKDYRPTDW